MDIQAPYNIERLIYFICNQRTDIVKSKMDEYDLNGKLEMDKESMEKWRYLPNKFLAFWP
jgi:hypothetical protein